MFSHQALERFVFFNFIFFALHDLCLWSVNWLSLLLISMTCSNRFVSKAKSMYLPFFFQLLKKKKSFFFFLFNFNQYYFTYCRDSNLCDLQQPKYCSVQFCPRVWTVSVHSQLGWEFELLYSFIFPRDVCYTAIDI